MTKGEFEITFDPYAYLHKMPIRDMEEARDLTKEIIEMDPEILQEGTAEEIAEKIYEWFSVAGLSSCHCIYCSQRQIEERAKQYRSSKRKM